MFKLRFAVFLVLCFSVNKIRTSGWDGQTPWFYDSSCNCNGFSNRCYFDKDLYARTGHGGHCMDCAANRDGPNCERCHENYYQREDHLCVACDCDPIGSRSLQCNSEGKCQCKPGVTGEKCDRCDVNYYEFTTNGCKICGCSEAGSAYNVPNCDPYSGNCQCKENVEGKRCRECKPSFFNLDVDNEFGCTPCFCYGHSSECTSTHGYSRYQLESVFSKSSERWKAEDEHRRSIDIQYNAFVQSIGVSAPGDEPVFFLAPERFLGDQRASYNQLLEFTLRIGENRAVPTAGDIVLEGAGSYVTNTIFAQRNQVPNTNNQLYKFHLHEHSNYGWQPRLSARAFMSILSNLTAIRIRGTYSPRGVGFLDDVKLETAARGIAGKPALWVEQCECPIGYVGQFCESCAPGYRHPPAHGGPFSACIPCDCNKHADICESETGRCICQHHTAGDNCELCARGFYGNALTGTPGDCQPCGCPNGGACIQLDEDIVMCVECPLGYTGHRCDFCSDGYFGDPAGRFGPATPCQQCECNLNIDTNAIGNCNTTTGECLKCVHNTGGIRCEHCLPGFYGNALALPKGDCQACQCYPPGTAEGYHNAPSCDQISGECYCKVHVTGRNCDKCEDGYYNIGSGEGCEPCNCDMIGSVNHTCSVHTGQCHCRPGVTGKHCDRCEDYRYGFSSEGCKGCDCDPIGSKGPQCDLYGQCPCLDNVEGRSCDRCKENKYDRQRGCINCPDCYNLVQDEAKWHLRKLQRLRDILDRIERNPTVIDDAKFEEQLKQIQVEVESLLQQAKVGTGGDGQTIAEKLADIQRRQNDISRELLKIEENISLAHKKGEDAQVNVTYAEDTIKMAESELNEALESLDTEGKEALEKAKQRATEFGQQSDKMTVIAQESRSLADTLDMNADQIIHTATEAMNKSTEAYELAKNATDLQRAITQDIRTLKNEIAITDQKLNGVKHWTEEVHNKSTEAKNKALLLLNEISNLVIPDIDVPKLKKQVEDTKEEAKRLLNVTETLVNKSQKLLADVEEQIFNSKDLLSRGTEQQDITNDLLSDIDFAKARADNAVTLGQGILNEAKATFETLSHFDKQVKDSQMAAEQALGRIPEIQKIIRQAVNKTKEAEISLVDSKVTADHALAAAVQANELAKTASKEAQGIRNEAEFLYQNASGLKQEAGLMAERVENTENGYQKLVLETQNNETLINEANTKIGRAAKDTKEATKKVNDILKDVESIMNELQGLPNLDDADLNRLEQELLKAEHKVQEANLDSIVQQLQKEHKQQQGIVDDYNMQIEWLRKEVGNIRDIANALPEGCFKRVELEP